MKPMMDSEYCDGGMTKMASGGEVMDKDTDQVMDHVAMELIHAIEIKDKAQFKESLEVLVSHICQSMNMEKEGD